jgi:preprotein translocase subunit SecA
VYEGKVVIVDEKTGRMMEGRSWSGGLHQAVEVKEGIELTDATQSHIQMSFQMFFRLYRDLAGMSGTLQNIEKELWRIYGLITVNIPTHAPKQLTVYPEKLCNKSDDKWDRVIDSVLTCVKQGRAVLVGTRSIRESESLYQKLFERGVDATVLNALRHEQEAQIIAHAGRRGRVTIATNMAGRGTDILVDPEVLQAGGLHVIATERHESRRVDMQLYGRTARQGLPEPRRRS